MNTTATKDARQPLVAKYVCKNITPISDDCTEFHFQPIWENNNAGLSPVTNRAVENGTMTIRVTNPEAIPLFELNKTYSLLLTRL